MRVINRPQLGLLRSRYSPHIWAEMKYRYTSCRCFSFPTFSTSSLNFTCIFDEVLGGSEDAVTSHPHLRFHQQSNWRQNQIASNNHSSTRRQRLVTSAPPRILSLTFDYRSNVIIKLFLTSLALQHPPQHAKCMAGEIHTSERDMFWVIDVRLQ